MTVYKLFTGHNYTITQHFHWSTPRECTRVPHAVKIKSTQSQIQHQTILHYVLEYLHCTGIEEHQTATNDNFKTNIFRLIPPSD